MSLTLVIICIKVFIRNIQSYYQGKKNPSVKKNKKTTPQQQLHYKVCGRDLGKGERKGSFNCIREKSESAKRKPKARRKRILLSRHHKQHIHHITHAVFFLCIYFIVFDMQNISIYVRIQHTLMCFKSRCPTHTHTDTQNASRLPRNPALPPSTGRPDIYTGSSILNRQKTKSLIPQLFIFFLNILLFPLNKEIRIFYKV